MKKLLAILTLAVTTSLFSATKIIPLKLAIAEESFQTYIVIEALKELGYEVEPIKEVTYSVAFQTIAQNSNSKDIYFMADHWYPMQENMYKNAGGDEKFYREGVYIDNCAQGYLIDKKTAQKYGIKYINDLKDPKIAKLFDSNGNGKANLASCNAGWVCSQVIEHQLKSYNLKSTVELNQGEYSAIIANTISRYKNGKPILYYTWTPYWISGKLVPGRDTVWLQVTHSSHPTAKSTKLSNGMDFGFNVNQQKIVANKSIAKNYPDVAKLFSIMKLNINDISAQNMLILKGENREKDIQRHAKLWIRKNIATFKGWIREAKKAK